MKAKLPMIARILLGLVFFASGVAGLFNLAPPPPDMPEKLMTFMSGIIATGYFMPLLKITEIICGLMLMSGFFVPLALVILAPIMLNIFFVHLLLEPKGLPMAVILGLFTVYLSFFAQPYSTKIRQLFTPK